MIKLWLALLGGFGALLLLRPKKAADNVKHERHGSETNIHADESDKTQVCSLHECISVRPWGQGVGRTGNSFSIMKPDDGCSSYLGGAML